MAPDQPDDYKVGYGRPPKKTQFKPGKSGNPKGRPGGHKNLKTDLVEELSERIRIREGDREFRVTKQRALIKSQVARGLKGNDRAARQITDLYVKLVGILDEANAADVALTEEERAVMENLQARILNRAGRGPGGQGGAS